MTDSQLNLLADHQLQLAMRKVVLIKEHCEAGAEPRDPHESIGYLIVHASVTGSPDGICEGLWVRVNRLAFACDRREDGGGAENAPMSGIAPDSLAISCMCRGVRGHKAGRPARITPRVS